MHFSQLPSADVLRELLLDAERRGLDSSILEKLRVILAFADGRQSISETCRSFGIARSTFHRWMERFDPRDLSTLQDRSREGLTPRTTMVDQEMIDMVRRYRMRYPLMGKEKIAETMSLEGMEISASTVGRIIERECLYFADTPYHWKKRMSHRHDQQMEYCAAVEHDSINPILPLSRSVGEADLEVQPSVQHNEAQTTVMQSDTRTSVSILSQQLENSAQRSSGDTVPTSSSPLLRFGVIVSLVLNVVIVGVLLVSAMIESGMVEGSYFNESTLHAAPSAIILNQ